MKARSWRVDVAELAGLCRPPNYAERFWMLEAELAVARAKASDDQALIAHHEKLTRQLYGPRSERRALTAGSFHIWESSESHDFKDLV